MIFKIFFIGMFKKEYGIPGLLCSASLLSVKTWMEGTYGMPCKNPYFFATTEPNRMEFSPRCRYLVIVLNPKAYLD